MISTIREEFKSGLAIVNNREDGVEDKIAKQAGAIDNIMERVTVLENNRSENSSLPSSTSSAIDNVVHEVKERDYTSTNIGICSLQDFKSSSQEDIAAVKAKNLQLAKDVLLKMSVDSTAIRMTFRLKTFNAANSRLLKVVLNLAEVAKSILENRRTAGLSKSIYTKTDQTPVYQQVLKKLNHKKEKHNVENPRNKVTVRYVL